MSDKITKVTIWCRAKHPTVLTDPELIEAWELGEYETPCKECDRLDPSRVEDRWNRAWQDAQKDDRF